jgi:hypothetical protein
VPVWAKLLAVLVAAATVPLLALMPFAGALVLNGTNADLHRVTSFDVGQAPRLQVDARFGWVVIEAGSDGRVVVDERQSADGLTRAAAAAALRRTAVRTSRRGDLVVVGQDDIAFPMAAFSRDSVVTIRVPVHTDLDVSHTNVQVQGIDGTIAIRDSWPVRLRSVVLRGTSTIDVPHDDVDIREVTMREVTVTGATTVTAGQSTVWFDGSLTPGGSSLDITTMGVATVTLPRPTDARATVVAPTQDLRADPAWGFASDPPHTQDPQELLRWTADLGPDPRGTVTVHGGYVQFDVR